MNAMVSPFRSGLCPNRPKTNLVVLATVSALLGGCASGAPEVDVAGLPGEAQAVEVVAHVDGDTVRVRLSEDGPAGRGGEEVSVRLLEIDTPEVGRDGEVGECFAEQAAERTADLLPVGGTAYALPDRELLDQYGRTLLYLWTADDGRVRFVNETLVAEGLARAVMYPPNDRYEKQMRAAQARARSADRGLWGGCAFFGEPAS